MDITKNKENKEEKNNEIYTVFHYAEDYLKEHYEFRFNEIALDIECKKIDGEEWKSVNMDGLWLEMQKKQIKISIQAVKSILKSEFTDKYNPIKEYFDNLPKWDGKIDYITNFASYITLTHPKKEEYQFLTHFKKWLVRVVKTAIIKGFFNKQAFILADNGLGQNIGKTTYLRYLMPPNLNKYIAEDINGNDKDARILLCKNLLINMDELATLSRKDINHLKAYFTKTQINDRLPYETKNSIIERISSFMGSTNQTSFLRDETGSVRWLIFSIKSIDWKYSKEFNINNLWMQAVALANDKGFNEKMTRDDIIENERRNKQYQVLTKEQELIYKFFDKPTNNIPYTDFMTSSDIALFLKENTALNSVPYEGTIGKAMHSLGFVRNQQKKNENYSIYGYYVIKKEMNYK